MESDAPERFALFAEIDGHPQPLLMLELSFARLLDEVVKPYEEGEPFFVDGAPVNKGKVRKLKILRLKPGFDHAFKVLNLQLHRSGIQLQKVVGEQYHLRLEALLREYGEDVTAQVIKAYIAKVKPNLKNYLPKREEFISLAYKFFFEAVKSLGGMP